MNSITSKTILVLTAVVMTSLRAEPATSHDDVCMTCTCDSRRCFREKCCNRFDTSDFTMLRVSVDCSMPADSHIIEPVGELNRSSIQCAGYHIYHPFGCLTQFPDNYCRFNETRVITLTSTSIVEFPDLQCLPLLGRLNLRYNRLRTVPENAFHGVPYLRHVLLDGNKITHIHPKTFDVDLANLQLFSVSYNRLVTFEASLVMVLHPFCTFDFSHNLITGFNNTNNFQLDTGQEYGPGYVDLSYNQITEGLTTTLRSLGVKTKSDYVKFYSRWGFDIRHNPLHCDCNIFGVAFLIKMFTKFPLWRDYLNITCGTPPRFSGIPLYQLPLDQLTCDVPEGCHEGCHCENVPQKETTSVNCDAVGLTSFPTVMPRGRRLKLSMTNNSLGRLPFREYLSRAATIDLRGNGLTEIEGAVPHLLRDADLVDLRDNDLRHFPETFRALRPEALHLDLHTWRCSCHLQWVGDWLRFSDDHSHLDNLTCTTGQGRRVSLASATKEDLGCYQHPPDLSSYKTALVIGSVSLLGVAALLVVFRYEILVLCQYLAARRQTRTPVGTCRYQVFVSVNADSAEDCGWVRDVLLPALDHLGLSSFLPPRDCLVGSVEMDEVTKHLHQSAAALVVVSPDYVDSGPCLFQFSQAYSHMVANRHGPLLVVQLSPVSRRAAREPRLRAMLTLRLFRSADPQRLHAALTTLLTASSQVKTPQAATVGEPNFDTW
ncbi:slit homolog 1 protein-like [Littorina saxatilis]|uniref:TIR domain-containing protein n=1 Tax=Littorina saxatilis TaxID=31220 RepID=A0AAN9B0R2_9CAEN